MIKPIDTKNSNVSIVDDDLITCEAYLHLFKSVHIEAYAYQNANDFLNSYNKKTGCLILDVRMPGMSGLELLEHLQAHNIKIPAIVVTGYGDVTMAVRAMKAGAEDFFVKPVNQQTLLEASQRCLIKNYNIPDKIEEQINRLSKREKEVMDLIVEGKLNKQMAALLKISISTVEVHRANVMRKMEVKTLAELIKKIYYFTNLNKN
ncbi:response regulator transcription factor [Legionella sp. PC997]|uniref:response regulator transcription factor n=1 Tax=Legionella sp. PC997 TaxID=2755562 RepID=UPI001861D8F1|nr:response regulator [Legionella sp. PC997]QMT62066.1 DNA-binding response regulator [Legionella sp. PC997]